ncbi:hypothetical protein SO574_15055 [Vibrio alfacsensis]|uniref:hypothetical protein n=1 Tax=Vibrio alfacsensis TaxID=1074311 RepID=UPI002ADD3CE5|nr:hypothetical protein [Vibrio alfacsensis]WQE78464.1 hypothetical protein SO574_15055 [Vibrio alfacsensis]
MNRIVLTLSAMAGLLSSPIWADEIKLTGNTIDNASINSLTLKRDAFVDEENDKGVAIAMKQGKFKFDRGYDDGFVGPAAIFQTDNIVTCSQPLVKITSLADFSQFPDKLNPFPTYGITAYDNQPIQHTKSDITRIGFRLYKGKSLMDFSGLGKLPGESNAKALSSIESQFGQPSFVLKRNNGWRVLYLGDSVDVQAVQLAYENALNPEKNPNYLNITPSTVLYGVMLDASFNSDLKLNIDGEVLEFFVSQSEDVMVFTKYEGVGKFIQRFNSELEQCDSKAD